MNVIVNYLKRYSITVNGERWEDDYATTEQDAIYQTQQRIKRLNALNTERYGSLTDATIEVKHIATIEK